MSLFMRSIFLMGLFAGLASFAFAGSFTFTTIADPSATSSTSPYGINNAGQVIGSFFSDGTDYGFLYSGGTYTTVSDPLAGSGGTVAYGINDAGQIVGAYSTGSGEVEGFLDSGGNFYHHQRPVVRRKLNLCLRYK
jgi:probable HAF family extracellular repeat protein